MIINKMIAGTNKSYKDKIKLRIGINLAFIMTGLASLTIYFIFKNSIQHEFFSGFYLGTGGGITTACAVLMVKNLMLLKNREKAKEQEIEENDERNQYIIEKASSTSYFAVFFALYGAILVSGVINPVVCLTLLAVCGSMMIIWLAAFLICRTMY